MQQDPPVPWDPQVFRDYQVMLRDLQVLWDPPELRGSPVHQDSPDLQDPSVQRDPPVLLVRSVSSEGIRFQGPQDPKVLVAIQGMM